MNPAEWLDFMAEHKEHTVEQIRTHLPEIDTRKKDDDDEIFDIIEGDVFPISPREVVLLDLLPEIKMPNDLGLQLLPSVPYVMPINLTRRPVQPS